MPVESAISDTSQKEFANTSAPRIMPTTVPRPATRKPILAFRSPFDLATAARIKPMGPKMIGRNRNAIAPQMIAPVENPLPARCEGPAGAEGPGW